VRTLLEADLVDALHLLVYPLSLGGGKRIFPEGALRKFKLRETTPYPTGVVGLYYDRQS
jgi:dihydrofolate reductase